MPNRGLEWCWEDDVFPVGLQEQVSTKAHRELSMSDGVRRDTMRGTYPLYAVPELLIDLPVPAVEYQDSIPHLRIPGGDLEDEQVGR